MIEVLTARGRIFCRIRTPKPDSGTTESDIGTAESDSEPRGSSRRYLGEAQRTTQFDIRTAESDSGTAEADIRTTESVRNPCFSRPAWSYCSPTIQLTPESTSDLQIVRVKSLRFHTREAIETYLA